MERSRAEAALRQVEERQAFLLDLSDRLRLQKDADQIEQEASRLLGELLGVSVVYFGRLLEDEVEVANEFRRQGKASQLGRYGCQIRSTPVEMARQGRFSSSPIRRPLRSAKRSGNGGSGPESAASSPCR